MGKGLATLALSLFIGGWGTAITGSEINSDFMLYGGIAANSIGAGMIRRKISGESGYEEIEQESHPAEPAPSLDPRDYMKPGDKISANLF